MMTDTNNRPSSFDNENENSGAPNPISLKEKEFTRRIFAEDPEWNILSIKKLSDMCLDVLVENFEHYPILDKLPPKFKRKVLGSLPVNLPLQLATEMIPDGDIHESKKYGKSNYWERRALDTLQNCDVQEHRDSWKRLFFEKTLQGMLERYVPPVTTLLDEISLSQKLPQLVTLPSSQKNPQPLITDIEQIIQVMKIGSPFVKRLRLTQLRSNEGDATSNHINFKYIFDNLKLLEELDLYFGVKDTGINFEWRYFGITPDDTLNLASCIRMTGTLKKLTIKSSSLDNAKLNLLAQAILGIPCIEHLDFSNNHISDAGLTSLTECLENPKCNIKNINLSNNQISNEGIKSLANSLGSTISDGKNTSLEDLRLAMNKITDEGGEYFFTKLKENKILSTVDLSANLLGMKTVHALSALLNHNLSCGLRQIYLNCIQFNERQGYFNRSDPAGKILFEAISINKHVVTFDLRQTDLLEENLQVIQSICKELSLALFFSFLIYLIVVFETTRKGIRLDYLNILFFSIFYFRKEKLRDIILWL